MRTIWSGQSQNRGSRRNVFPIMIPSRTTILISTAPNRCAPIKNICIGINILKKILTASQEIFS